jgi:hypothetical protein
LTLEFDLHLADPKEMFINPHSYDPFDENALGESGLDYLLARMIGFWLTAPPVRARIILPPEKIEPGLEARMRRAMQYYIDDLLIENHRERVEFLINNTIFLGIAIIVLVASWLVQGTLVNPVRIPDPQVLTIVQYGIDILIWVALWTPVSAFMLEWFPLFRRQQAYKSLQKIELIVQPETKPADPLLPTTDYVEIKQTA